MTYDNELAHRIREQLGDERGITEKAMFGRTHLMRRSLDLTPASST